MKWHEALKQWNAHKKTINAAHVFALPRKGTPEHAEVKAIQDPPKKHLSELRAEHAAKKAAEAPEAPEPKSKAEKKKEAAAKKHAAIVRQNERVHSGKAAKPRSSAPPKGRDAEKSAHRDEIIKILSEMWTTK
jgi:membrane protein involved in colicin uptake